ncbi:FUSC family protein [Rhizobium alvei]|uniref:FUSC family protein n=1 Tax=Rhizobium alvei TaxID=1132659 RepID=A0ABT8YKD4_9HYPH|nr:FUSC family protein [Rhizobium alvei]MDO6964122.1 FUSC family protein [Rhizobium alvei]
MNVLSSCGFETSRLPFAFRTAFAACLALLFAFLLGLEHPQWSAMTVWAVSQPLRGHLLEKSLARLLGTLIGAAFGLCLMLVAGNAIPLIVLGMAIWMALCAFIGNMLRGYASYAAMLSGYTAGMVTLLDAAHPTHVAAIGIDRLLTVALGVLAALVIGWIFADDGGDMSPVERARALTRRILLDVQNVLAGSPDGSTASRVSIGELAALEGILDANASRSRKARQETRKVRALLATLTAVVLKLQHVSADGTSATTFPLNDDTADTLLAMAQLERRASDRALQRTLHDLTEAYRALDQIDVTGAATPIHRDGRMAARSGIRIFIAMAAVGGLWFVSGSEIGGFMLLGTAIMLSVFSTFENPVLTLRWIFAGQLLGAVAALVCRWIFWPWADSSAGMIGWMVPVILIGALLVAHRKTARLAFDFNMVALLLLQPVWPQTMTVPYSIVSAIAVLTGPLIAMVAFKLVFPVDVGRRYWSVRIAMLDDLAHFAQAGLQPSRVAVWRSLFLHRVLMVFYWGERAGLSEAKLLRDAADMVAIVDAIDHLRSTDDDASGAHASRWRKTALARLQNFRTAPEKVSERLEKLTGMSIDPLDQQILHRAALAIVNQAGRDMDQRIIG